MKNKRYLIEKVCRIKTSVANKRERVIEYKQASD